MPIKAGDEIAHVLSPEQDSIVATYMRALADIAGRTAELRIKARVAQESLEAIRSYLRVTEEAVERIDAMSTGTVTFRMEVLRERASARKAVISQEAEVARRIGDSVRKTKIHRLEAGRIGIAQVGDLDRRDAPREQLQAVESSVPAEVDEDVRSWWSALPSGR